MTGLPVLGISEPPTKQWFADNGPRLRSVDRVGFGPDPDPKNKKARREAGSDSVSVDSGRNYGRPEAPPETA